MNPSSGALGDNVGKEKAAIGKAVNIERFASARRSAARRKSARARGALLACALIISLLLFGCGYVYQAEWLLFPEESSLTGRVVLEAGRGFDDVDAVLIRPGGDGEDEQRWDLELSGRGEFRKEDLPPGDYRLEITRPRYDPYVDVFFLGEDESIYLEVELKRYTIPERIWDVRLVGDFQDWDLERAVPLEDEDGDGLWEASLPFPSGRYRYAYLINGLEERFIDIDSHLYEPDGHGYYDSVVELNEARLVEFRLDATDDWYRRAVFDEPAEEPRTGWVIWEPEEPRRGQEVSILYDARNGPLQGAEQIWLHWGVNGWSLPPQWPDGSVEQEDGTSVWTPMDLLSEEIWWTVIPTGEEVEAVDLAFTDGRSRDDNLSRDWHIAILSFGRMDTLSFPQTPAALDTLPVTEP